MSFEKGVLRSYELPGGRLRLYAGDITRLRVDAVVTAANRWLRGGGGVDGAVHRAAGPELLRACQDLPADERGVRCPTGEARITPGFRLAPWVVHAVGPVYDPRHPERSDALLASAYDAAFALAARQGCRSLAVPSLSTGVYRFPPERAAPIALDRALAALSSTPVEELTFALLDPAAWEAFEREAERRLSPSS